MFDDYDYDYIEDSGEPTSVTHVQVEPGITWRVYQFEDDTVSVIDARGKPVDPRLISEYSDTLTAECEFYVG